MDARIESAITHVTTLWHQLIGTHHPFDFGSTSSQALFILHRQQMVQSHGYAGHCAARCGCMCRCPSC